jgi:hypothetical protein
MFHVELGADARQNLPCGFLRCGGAWQLHKRTEWKRGGAKAERSPAIRPITPETGRKDHEQ